MSSHLDEACAILDDFEKDIAGVQAIWEQLAEDNQHLEQVAPETWQGKKHRMWLHGASKAYECSELERWLSDYPPSTAIAHSPAEEVYTAWRKWLPIAWPVEVAMVTDYESKSRIQNTAISPFFLCSIHLTVLRIIDRNQSIKLVDKS